MKSKQGENFLSLQCKDSGPHPLPPSIFTDAFSPSASYERREREMFHLNEWEYRLYPHAPKVVWENCLTHLRSIASVFMSFSRHCHWNLITNCYLYGWKSSDPLPPSIFTLSPGFDSIPQLALLYYLEGFS